MEGWVDIFTRINQKYNIVNALQYCQDKKVLEIYAYCIMHGNIHLMSKAKNDFILSEVMRHFKKHTSNKIIETIMEEPKSNRKRLLYNFKKAFEHLKRDQSYKVRQDGYHAEIIETNWFIKQKVDYIHNNPNPVKDKVVTLPEDYYFSSARNYAGLENDLDIVMLDLLRQFG